VPKLASAIDHLPISDHEQILGWLESYPTYVVVEKIAKAPPEGYGIRTHITTLRRFYARNQAASATSELEIAKLFDSNDPMTQLEVATENLLRNWAFQIATDPQRTTGAFKALSCWLQRAKEQQQREIQLDLNRQRLALEREKFEFNAARQALIHHEGLGKILEAADSSDEQKIYAAREALFGKAPKSDGPGISISPA
jgi:hypothetical protein